jgi:hypothetical protein
MGQPLAGVLVGQVTMRNRRERTSGGIQAEFLELFGVELRQKFLEFGGGLGTDRVCGIGLMAGYTTDLVKQSASTGRISLVVEPRGDRSRGCRLQLGKIFAERRQES